MGKFRSLRALVPTLAAVALAASMAAWLPGAPLHRLRYGVKPGVRLDGRWVGGLYPDELRELVLAQARKVERSPADARIDPETGQVVDGSPGLRLDVEATLERVRRARVGERVTSVRVPVPPRWTREHLSRLVHPAGRFATGIYGSAARQHNVRKALGHINNVLVLPGEVFSFNRLMPEYTEQAGWMSAQVIEDGQLIPGVGGGVCQVSSTLYNAVLMAGLKVLERHPHSAPVPYIASGRDACVAIDPPKDLKFQNDTPWPVLVKGWLEGSMVTVAIYTVKPGTAVPPDGRT